MKRALTQKAYVQTSELVDNGLESVVTWNDGSWYPTRVLPASYADIQRAGLRDEVATHSAIMPRGLSLSTLGNRLKVGTQIYRIVSVMQTTRSTVLLLEARDGQQ